MVLNLICAHVYQPCLVYELLLGLSPALCKPHFIVNLCKLCTDESSYHICYCEASVPKKKRQHCHEEQNTLLLSTIHVLANALQLVNGILTILQHQEHD